MSSLTADPHTQPGPHGDSAHGGADAHAHGHGDFPFLAHHFESPAQQFDSAKLGMWLFLATEVLFFGGLFVAYTVLRNRFPQVFSYASHYLNTLLGGTNTCVLILSSLTMAMGVRFAQLGRKTAMLVCLWLTLGGAVGFLVIKYFEYSHKIHAHLIWGPGFYDPVTGHEGGEAHAAAPAAHAASGAAPAAAPAPAASGIAVVDPAKPAVSALLATPAVDAPQITAAGAGPSGFASLHEEAKTEGLHEGGGTHEPAAAHLDDPKMPPGTHEFFAIYYAMTGLHGIHVLVGIIVISWLIFRGMRGDFGPKYYTPVDLGGLYWHIVDLVWIFLFPLFYLIH